MIQPYYLKNWLATLFLIIAFTGAFSQNVVKPTVKAPNGFDVNSFSGNLYHQRIDLKMPAQGIPMEIVFSYNNSQRYRNWGYGRGWTFTYNVGYTVDSNNNIVVLRADGRRDVFTKVGAAYKAPVGVFDTLTEYQSGQFKLNTKEGWTYYFDQASHRKLTSIVDRNNNAIHITYTDSVPTAIADAAGRTITLTWSNGRLQEIQNTCAAPVKKIAFTYDANGNPVKVMRPDSSTLQYYYDDVSRIIGYTDEVGNSMSITYNGNGAVSKIVSCATTQLFTYSPTTRKTFVTEQVQGQRQITTYNYDTTGRIIHKEGNCCGYNVAYQYDANNNIAAQTNGNNQTTKYVYDTKGNVLKETDAEGNIMSYTWHPVLNKVVTVKDKMGNVTAYEYDAAGNVTKILKPLGISEAFTYDAKGNVLTHKDGNNNTTAYEYNNYGQLTKTTDALNGVVTNMYDGCGNLVQVKDARNNSTFYEYDGQNRVTKITDALGGITKYSYDAAGNLSSQTDALNRTTTHIYDGLGRRIKTVSPSGNTTSVEYDERGNKIKVTDARGNSTAYTYNSRNQVLTEKDALGYTRSFEYDGAGNRISETDKKGNTTKYEYDGFNRLKKITNAEGGVSTISYDANGNKIAAKDFNGNVTYSAYDALNRLSSITDAFNKSIVYVYDPNGNVLSQKDKNNNTWTMEYDVLNRKKKSSNPLSQSIEMTYDPNGNLLSFKNQLGFITSFSYDVLNRRFAQTNPLNEITSFVYDLTGSVKIITLPNGNVINNTYDSEGRLRSVSDNLGVVGDFTYDANGNQLTEKDGGNHTTTFQYDKLNRTEKVVDAMGKVTVKQYDAAGNIVMETDRNNNNKQFEYDRLSRCIRETNALANSTRFEYDANGNRTRIVDAKNNITSYSFDALDRLIQETYADGTRKDYAYDGNGNRKIRKDNNGNVTTYVYDAANRLIERNYPGGKNESFTYDATGKKLTANNSNAAIAFAYDNSGRMLSESLNGKTTTYAYNTANGVVTTTYPGGRVITANHDQRNRLATITDAANTMAQFTYDDADKLVSKVLGNGMTQHYTYDANGRVLSFDCQPNNVLNFQYSYDNEGNRISCKKNHRPNRSEKYEYDKVYQLTGFYQGLLTNSVVSDTTSKNMYAYDQLHNRMISNEDNVSKVYSANFLNAYSQVTTNGVSKNYTYDKNGNMIANGAVNYQYDYENRLSAINNTSQYQYDALGRKIKTINNGIETFHYYANNQIIEERNAANIVQKTFVFGVWLDDVISFDDLSSTKWISNSPQGSIYAVYEGGNAIEKYDYKPFGLENYFDASYNTIAGSGIGNNLTFCGRNQFDGTSYDFRTRIYEGANGRFIQRDLAGYINGYNLYSAYFVPNNIDPYGLYIEPALYGLILYNIYQLSKVGDIDLLVREIQYQLIKGTGAVKGDFALSLLERYMYGTGIDWKLTKHEVAEYLDPLVNLYTDSKAFQSDIKVNCSDKCGSFSGKYAMVIGDGKNPSGGLGSYTVKANVSVKCNGPSDWTATGTASIYDSWDFDWTLEEVIKDADGRGLIRHLRTMGGDLLIRGTKFKVYSEEIPISQNGPGLMKWQY